MDSHVLNDGIIIDVHRNTVIDYFQSPEMPIYSVSSGMITPNGEILAFGIVSNVSVSRAVRFDEPAMRFDSIYAILNDEDYFKESMEET